MIPPYLRLDVDQGVTLPVSGKSGHSGVARPAKDRA